MLLDQPEISARLSRSAAKVSGTSLTARLARIGVLLFADAAALTVVSAVAVRIWAVGVLGQTSSLYIALIPILPVFLVGFAKAGLYPGFGLGAVETIKRFSLWITYLFALLAAASFVFKVPHQYSRATFLLAWVGCVSALPLARFAVLSSVGRFSWWGEPAVIIDTGPLSRRVIRSLQRSLTLGFRPAVVIAFREDVPSKIEKVPVLRGMGKLEELASNGIHVAILATETVGVRGETVEYLQRHFRRVLVVPQDTGIPIEGVEIRNLGSILGIEFRNQLLIRRHRIVKRLMDIVLGTAGVVLFSPIILAAALLIRTTSPGPAFFSQTRIGLRGQRIRVWKLRTMYVDAERRLTAVLERDPNASREWNSKCKLEHDPRIIPGIGTFLRRFSIDELPQIWQVLIGDLSLVGPRPFPEYHLRRFSSEFRALRARVRPGVTGLWQVMVRSRGGLDEQQTYDTYYIRNWSLWLDIFIIFRTVAAVLFARGAH